MINKMVTMVTANMKGTPTPIPTPISTGTVKIMEGNTIMLYIYFTYMYMLNAICVSLPKSKVTADLMADLVWC